MAKVITMFLIMICVSFPLLAVEKDSDYFCWVQTQKNVDSKNIKLEVYYQATPEHGGIFVSPNCRGGIQPGVSKWLDRISKKNSSSMTRLKLEVIADFKSVSNYFGLEGKVPDKELNLNVKKVLSSRAISKADWDKIFEEKQKSNQSSQ